MKFESLAPNLMVKDVNESIKYYTEILGFSLLMTQPEQGVFEWAFMQKDNIYIMFQKESSIKAEYPQLEALKVGGALTFYVKVKEMKSFYENIKEKVNIIHELHMTPYGEEEFAIMDLNGFIFTFSNAS